MALRRKQVAASGPEVKNANNVTVVTKVKVTRVGGAVSVAKKSFNGLVEHKKKISSALREGKSLTDIKGIRFVKPF